MANAGTWESVREADPNVAGQELFKWKLTATFVNPPLAPGAAMNFMAIHAGFVDTTDTYIRLTDFNDWGLYFGGPHQGEKVAMISSTSFASLITARQTGNWDDFRLTAASPPSELGLLARMEQGGQVALIEGLARGRMASPLTKQDWGLIYKSMVKEPVASSWGDPLRAIDPGHQPPFVIYMVPTGTIYEAALQDAVDKVSANVAKYQVKIVYEQNAANCVNAGLIMYDVDPLNTYQTWIPKDFLVDYLSVHENYPLPTEANVAGILGTRGVHLDPNQPPDNSWTAKRKANDLADATAREEARDRKKARDDARSRGLGDPNADEDDDVDLPPLAPRDQLTDATQQALTEYTTIAVPTGKKILDASTIAREGSQKTVMGMGPNDLVTALGWPSIKHPLKPVTGKGPLNMKWTPPKFAQSPAEWLHKSAYKFAGLDAPNVIENLCIGSSETNSVMIRTEDLWKRLLVEAAAFQNHPTKDQRLSASRATLTVNALNYDWYYDTWELDQAGKPKRVNKGRNFQTPKPARPATERSWLIYGFSYILKLNMDTKMIRIPQLLQTRFWPFQRPFYFTVQGLVDRIMLKHLINDNLAHNGLPIVALAMMPGVGLHEGPGHEAKHLWSSARSGKPITIGGVTLKDVDLIYDPPRDPSTGIESPVTSRSTARRAPFDLRERPVHVNGIKDEERSFHPMSLTTLPVPSGVRTFALDSTTASAGSVPNGFVLTGSIKLFSLFDAKLYSLQGSASYFGVKEIVTLADELTMGSFIPALSGSSLDLIKISNVQLEYCEQHPQHRRAAGIWLKADLTLDGAFKPIADAMASVFGQKDGKVTVECLLSYGRGWDKLDIPPGLTLSCTVPGVDIQFGDLIRFTSLTVDIDVIKRFETEPYSEHYAVSAGLSGVALLSVHGSGAPLVVDFAMQPLAHLFSLNLTLRDESWKNMFGIEGLELSEVGFFTSFVLSASPKLIDFTISASLRTQVGDVAVSGIYMNDGRWRLEACLKDVDLDRIINMFSTALDQGDIVSFDQDIKFSTLWLTIDSEGIFLNGRVSVADHEALDAVLQIKRTGIVIQGKIEKAVEYGGFTLHDAALNVSIPAKPKPGAVAVEAYVSLGGTITFEKVSITTAVYLSRLPDDSIGFAFYGEYVGLLQLSDLVDAAKGTFLDIGLSKIAVIGGTTTTIPGMVGAHQYTPKKGVEFCASIANLPALESATKQKLDGLVLRAGYDVANKLSLAIDLPASTKIHFRPDLETGPISIGLTLNASPCITITAALTLAVQGRADPLIFTFGMNARITEASAFCQMDGYWIDPLGISPKLKIGPRMVLQLDLSYAPPAVSVGIEGGFALGTKTLQAAVVLGNDPKTELISASVEDLSVQDLTSFAIDATGLSIPEVGKDVLNIKKAAFSMSTGVRLGTVDHPAGIILDGAAVIFDKNASLTCKVLASQGLALAGALDAFTLGPLSVTGKHGPRPEFAIALSPAEQKFFVNGKVDILEESASIFVDAKLLPSPSFIFDADLNFTDALQYKLHAQMLGQFSIEHIGDLDFVLSVSLEQHIREYVTAQLKVQLEAASKGAKDGFDKATLGLQQAKKLYEDGIATTQAAFDTADKNWTALQTKVNGALSTLEANYAQRHGELLQQVTNCETAFNTAVTNAENALGSTRNTANAVIQAAENEVSNKRTQGDADIRRHEQDVSNAKGQMQRDFGDASKTLEDKRRDFDDQERGMKPIRDQISDLEGRRGRLGRWDVFEKGKLTAQIAVLEAQKLALQGAWTAAQLALLAAQAVVDGPGYKAAQASVAGYEASLELARTAAKTTLSQAEASLQTIRTTQNAVVKTAEDNVKHVRESGAEKALWDGARKAAQDFEDSMKTLLANAHADVSALANAAEKTLYDNATAALTAAKDDKAAYDAAQKALKTAQELESIGEHVAKYILDHAGVIVDVNEVKMNGQLKGLISGTKPLTAAVRGTLAAQDFDLSVDFTPGKAADFIHGVFEKLWDDLVKGVLSIV